MPTKADYITQIAADLEAGTEAEDVLSERMEKVKAARDDAGAREAYEASLAERSPEPG